MKQLPEQIKAALIARFSGAIQDHKNESTHEIDVEGLIAAVLDDMASSEPEAYTDLEVLAPAMVARDFYQKVQRDLRYVVRGRRNFGVSYRDEHPAGQALINAAPEMLAHEEKHWRDRWSTDVLETQYALKGADGRWKSLEYGDLTVSQIRQLEDRYGHEARSKQRTADMLRTDRELFERKQRECFGNVDDDLTLRTFLERTEGFLEKGTFLNEGARALRSGRGDA